MLMISLGCQRQSADSNKDAEAVGNLADHTFESTAENTAENGHKDGIHWLKGDVDAAFATAALEHKLILLYWGAVWCPPCNQLKATLFKDRDFIAKTRLLVPVYLDGDTANAQQLGEKFNISGYPTLILLKPEGEEITRIPGGMDLSQYEAVLELAIQMQRPVRVIVAEFRAGKTLSDKDFRLLALYSWDQDRGSVLSENEASALLLSLYQACPETQSIDKSRLFAQWWSMRLEELDEQSEAGDDSANAGKTGEPAPAPQISAEEHERVYRGLSKILASRELIRNNLDLVLYGAGDTFEYLFPAPDNESGSAELLQAWNQALADIRLDQSLSLAERLAPLYAQIQFQNLNTDEQDMTASPELQADIRNTIATIRSKISNRYEHSAVVNLAVYLLSLSGQNQEAGKLLEAELKNAASPYYLMLDLAETAKELGHEEDALQWMKRAYNEAAEGPTRFQWGVYYLRSLADLQPDNETDIETLVSELFAILQSRDDAFYNRNQRSVQRMAKILTRWNEDKAHAAALSRIQLKANNLCNTWKAEPEGENYQRCETFAEELDKNSSEEKGAVQD